jgi:hypothetical protein
LKDLLESLPFVIDIGNGAGGTWKREQAQENQKSSHRILLNFKFSAAIPTHRKPVGIVPWIKTRRFRGKENVI